MNEEIPSYSHILELLKKARRNDCVGQAYMLIGDDAAFLNDFSREWMKTAACLSSAPDGSPCGKCSICQAIDAGRYEECFKVAPLSKSRVITIDAMREFDHLLGLAGRQGHLKIGLVSEAECMNEEAQNSFLKTLEEPPRGTMLLLLTTNPRKLLPTIRSRCQLVSLMRNRKDYSLPAKHGFFEILATMRRRAGLACAMDATDRIRKIFDSLASEAEAFVEENWDATWEQVEDGNPQLKKQLAELKQKKIDTEYCRLRELYLDALQAWFLQQYLMAAGVEAAQLPHPEFLQFHERNAAPMDILEAEENLVWAENMLKCLKANVNENIALMAFALQVCEKTR